MFLIEYTKIHFLFLILFFFLVCTRNSGIRSLTILDCSHGVFNPLFVISFSESLLFDTFFSHCFCLTVLKRLLVVFSSPFGSLHFSCLFNYYYHYSSSCCFCYDNDLCVNQVERAVTYNEHRPRKPPPDLPSLLLHGRIVYIGMPVSL